MHVPARVTLGLLAATALALGACGSGDDGGDSAAPTVTVTETRTVTPTGSASPTGSPTETGTASPTATARTGCTADQVRAEVREEQAGAGQRYAAVVLTNTGDKACTVTGYPGLQLVADGGRDIATKVVRRKKPAPATVRLRAGASASSAIVFSVVASGDEPSEGPCRPQPTEVRVTPPDETASVTAAWNLGPVCSAGRIRANAFVAAG